MTIRHNVTYLYSTKQIGKRKTKCKPNKIKNDNTCFVDNCKGIFIKTP